MKRIICFLLALISLGGLNAQTTTFCLRPSCPQTIQLPVSIDTVFAQLNVSDGVKGLTWTQVSGPNTATVGTPILTPNGTNQTLSTLPLSKLVAGTYVFSVIGTSAGGSTGSATAQVIVLPAPAPPRTVVSVSFKLVNGIWVQSITFSDGSTQ